jgi:hypothetical protein
MPVESTFTVKSKAFIFLMERWGDWNCARSLGEDLGYPHSSEFVNDRVDNGGVYGAKILATDHSDMERIEMWVSHIAEQNTEIAECLRAHWEAKPIFHDKSQREKAAIVGVKVRSFRDKLSTGNLMVLMAMEVARFVPQFGHDDINSLREASQLAAGKALSP